RRSGERSSCELCLAVWQRLIRSRGTMTIHALQFNSPVRTSELLLEMLHVIERHCSRIFAPWPHSRKLRMAPIESADIGRELRRRVLVVGGEIRMALCTRGIARAR